MKNKFKAIICKLFTIHGLKFIKNIDDRNEGFEFNPDTRTLIIVKYPMGALETDLDSYISIDKYEIRLYPTACTERKIISDQVVLLSSGEIDWDFYEKLLRNYKSF
jgi:hypothetical protein